MLEKVEILSEFDAAGRAVVFPGDCLPLLSSIPDESVKLVVTSPPYKIGKEYEQRLNLDHYVRDQSAVIAECVRVLRKDGSICWLN
jgi:adenine-specific DNA-methyltransferase